MSRNPQEEYGGAVEKQLEMAKRALGTARTPEQWAEAARCAGVSGSEQTTAAELLNRLNRGE